MKKISLAICVLIVGLIASAFGTPAPELPILGKHYNIYTDRMGDDWRRSSNSTPQFHFDDSTSPDGFSKTDKGQGGYYSYELTDWGFSMSGAIPETYAYITTVCFQSDKRISLVSYSCLKGGRDRFFSSEEVEYLLAVTSGTSFKEIPLVHDFHCAGGLWKLYASADGRTEATVGYALESGKLEAFSVQVRSLDLKTGRVASCGGWIE